MKKRLSLIMIFALLVTTLFTSFAFAGNDISTDKVSKSDEAKVTTILKGIDDQEKAETIVALLGTIAYYKVGEPTSDELDAAKIVNKVEALSKLSKSELDKEIGFLTENTINNNLSNNDVRWDNEFIDKYAKKYSPGYTLQLESKTGPVEVIIDKEKTKVTQANSSESTNSLMWTGEDDIYANVTAYNVLGLAYTFDCHVNWGFDGSNVLYYTPQTEGSAIGLGVSYNGLSHSYQGWLYGSHYSALIEKEGWFTFSLLGYTTKNYHPYIQIVVRGDGSSDKQEYLEYGG